MRIPCCALRGRKCTLWVTLFTHNTYEHDPQSLLITMTLYGVPFVSKLFLHIGRGGYNTDPILTCIDSVCRKIDSISDYNTDPILTCIDSVCRKIDSISDYNTDPILTCIDSVCRKIDSISDYNTDPTQPLLASTRFDEKSARSQTTIPVL